MTSRAPVARLAIAFVLSVVLLYTLYELRQALLLFYVAIVLAIMFDPAVVLVQRTRIHRWRPGRGFSVAIVCLVTAGIVAVILLVILPPILNDATQLADQWPQQVAQILAWIHGHIPLSSSITADTLAARLQSLAGARPVTTVSTSIMDVLTTLLVGIYLLVDGGRAFAWSLSLLPEPQRPTARAALTCGAERMQRWVRGQGLLMLIHGGSAFVTFSLIGVPYASALGVFAGLINIIPFLGPILTLLAAGLIAATEAPDTLVGVVIFYLAYHNIESAVLQPRIMASAVGLPGVAIVMALVVGYDVAGVVGMVFAVPTTVLLAELKRAYPGAHDNRLSTNH